MYLIPRTSPSPGGAALLQAVVKPAIHCTYCRMPSGRDRDGQTAPSCRLSPNAFSNVYLLNLPAVARNQHADVKYRYRISGVFACFS